MERIEITKENYEGYVELFKTHYFTEEENKKIGRHTCLAMVVLLASMIALPILQASTSTIGIACYSSLALVAVAFIGTAVGSTNKKKKEIKEKYPDIDTKVDFDELSDALVAANILKFKDKSRTEYNIDLDAFTKANECKEILDNYIEETKYQPIEIEPEINEEQLEKARQKVITFVRK